MPNPKFDRRTDQLKLAAYILTMVGISLFLIGLFIFLIMGAIV